MENNDSKFTLSRNIGVVTGPLIVGLGIFSLYKGTAPQALSYTMIILGIIRIILTIYSFLQNKRQP
jgi:hypothetical protein